jgi:signal peptidase I
MRLLIVAGESMAPAVRDGDVFMVGQAGKVRRGDIVVFPHPRLTGMTLIKRVIGLPGETVAIEMGEVSVDGRQDIDRWGVGFTYPDGEWVTLDHHVFVLSDNRKATRDDSRNFGPIPERVLRRVRWRLRRGRPDAPGTLDQ